MGLLPFGIVRQTERGIIERLGKYSGYAEPGFIWLIPLADTLVTINVTEQMVDAEQQEVITKDNLNASVDAQIYFKVRSDEKSVKASQYGVFNYGAQIVALSRTTLRNIIGNMTLKDANSMRNKLNIMLTDELRKQTDDWGIEVVRSELKEIKPPSGVQSVMNDVVIAENKKIAALDFATAVETEADGTRRAAIKSAEGSKQAAILEAEGQAEALIKVAEAKAKQIKLVNESASQYFKGQAVELKKLEVADNVLASNLKVIVPQGSDIVNVMGDSLGIVPLKSKK